MDVPYLINILQNKFNYLNNARAAAAAVGDMGGITSIEQEILTTKNTLAQLQLLQSITQAAADTNTSATEVIANGLDTLKNTPVIPDGPIGVLAYYDLSTYAADPLYLQKITDILSVMGVMDSASVIDTYISNEAVGSPLTGQMIFDAVQKYSIDARLLVSMLELESRFGTAGVAVSTLNPGNVGNTGSETRTYASWSDGVAAVAEWLSRHRLVPEVIPEDPLPENATTTPMVATSTVPFTFTASTTPIFVPSVSTTTPPIIPPFATSTDQMATSTLPTVPPSATSTDSIATSTPPTIATSTPPTIPPIATSTPSIIVPSEATTTPEIMSTSTQATRWFGKGRKKRV